MRMNGWMIDFVVTFSYFALFDAGFFDECKRRYNIKLWKTFTDCFNCLPIAAIIDEKIFCCHGGLSPDLQDMEQIRRIVRPTDVPDTGLLCDLLWSDPDKEVKASSRSRCERDEDGSRWIRVEPSTAVDSADSRPYHLPCGACD